jgi:hypothetical protein
VLCSLQSIPMGVNLTTTMFTHDAWIDLMNNAKAEVDIALFYMTLTDGASLVPCSTSVPAPARNDSAELRVCAGPPEAGGQLGTDAYNAIIAAAQRGIKIRIAAVRRGGRTDGPPCLCRAHVWLLPCVFLAAD